MHELFVCVAKVVQKIGAHVQGLNVATYAPTSTSKTTKKTERSRRIPKKCNYTIYCDGENLDLEDIMVMVCLIMNLSMCLIALILTKLML